MIFFCFSNSEFIKVT